MVKTQVQIPDHLYDEAKRVAKEYEMSLAEVIRRGLERVLQSYPPRSPRKKWKRPVVPRKVGLSPLSPDELARIGRGADELPDWLLQVQNPSR